MPFRISVSIICLLLLKVDVFAQETDPSRLIIENVRLVSAVGDYHDVAVNLLIVDGVVDLMSIDPIPPGKDATVLNAAGGYLIGKPEVGLSPTIIIVDSDPRQDFDILLDTNTHATFAMADGVIARNELAKSEGVEPAATRFRWMAYEPPPVAIPANLGGSKPFNHWETKNTTGVFITVAALDRQEWLSQTNISEQQVGDLAEADRGIIRAFQFGIAGGLSYFNRPWSYTIVAASTEFDQGFDVEESDELSFTDYRLDIPWGDKATVSVGKQKMPISTERLMSLLHLPAQERAAPVDAMLPSRNFGINVSGTAFDDKVSWATGVFNNFIDADTSLSSAATDVAGRVTWVPWSSADDSNLFHLGLGLRHTDANLGVRYSANPEFSNAPKFVDTGLIDANGALTSDIEIGWRRGPLWVSAEILNSDVDAQSGEELSFDGHYLTASWILTGEMRKYNRRGGLLGPMPIAQSVDQGSWGSVELISRWSSVDLSDGSIDGGELDVYSIGANWWLRPSLYLAFDLRRVHNRRAGQSGWSTGALTRIVMILN